MSKEETNYNPARTTEAHHTQSMSIDEVNAQNKAKRKPEKPLQTQPKTKRTRDEQEVVNDDASGSRSPKDQDGVDQGDASEKKKKSKPQHDKTSHKNTSDEEVKDAKEQSSDEADQHTDKKAKKNEDDADDLTNTKEDLAKTGAGEPATQAQKGFIKTLSKQAGQDVDPTDFDRAEASKTIESLKPKADQQQPSALEADSTPAPGTHLAKPEQWATGEDPATEKQGRYLAVLERKAGEEVVGAKNMSKGEASEKINDLKKQTQA